MRKKLLFIHRDKNIKEGVYLDDLFNQGEVYILDDDVFFDDDGNYDEAGFYARNAGHVLHDTINFGEQWFYSILEEKDIYFPSEGVHRFKINGITYEIFIDDNDDIKSMVRINK
jgi:hypothetical protein